jgi:NADH dehydrogenase (ubiquinone) 1 alpha subcomplex subunit 6
LDISAALVRTKIRQEFEKHRYVNDLQTIDILLFKGRTEFEETMNMWKQKTHVMRYFDELDNRSTKKLNGFLDKFYAGQ